MTSGYLNKPTETGQEIERLRSENVRLRDLVKDAVEIMEWSESLILDIDQSDETESLLSTISYFYTRAEEARKT